MNQKILYLMAPDNQLQALASRLKTQGFSVRPGNRTAVGIQVRVREDTGDEAEVEQIAASVAPDMQRGPSAAPAQIIPGYRES